MGLKDIAPSVVSDESRLLCCELREHKLAEVFPIHIFVWLSISVHKPVSRAPTQAKIGIPRQHKALSLRAAVIFLRYILAHI